MRCFAVIAAALIMLLWSLELPAHPLAPVGLTVVETNDGVTAALKRARVQPSGAAIAPVWPASCRAGVLHATSETSSVTTHYALTCGDLVGQAFGIAGLEEAGIEAVVVVSLADGTRHQALLRGGESFVVPATPSSWQVAGDYLWLGVEHLWTGLDHLLLVLGLVLLVRRRRRVIILLTAFTVGHSATLCAAALGVLSLPQPPVEVAIAASLMWLAAEIVTDADGARHARGRACLWPAAVGVGLIHGLGFAGALSATGLPPQDVPLALASFNIGIELGQLALVLIAWPLPRPRKLRLTLGYATGCVAAMWFIERMWMVIA